MGLKANSNDMFKGGLLTFATSTSYALGDIARTIRISRFNVELKNGLKRGEYSLEEVNRMRKGYDLPPLGRIYMRRFRIQKVAIKKQ